LVAGLLDASNNNRPERELSVLLSPFRRLANYQSITLDAAATAPRLPMRLSLG
jgi:hypothetical protein